MTADLYEDEKMRPEESDLSSKQAFSKLLPFLKAHKSGLIVCLILLAFGTGLSLAWPVLLKRALDVNIADKDFKGLIVTVLFIALVQVTNILLQYFQRVKLEVIGQDIMVELRRKLFSHILESKVSFFDKNPVGRLMARVESDTDSLRQMFTNTVVMIVGDLILIFGIFGVMFYHSWRLSLVLAGYIPIIFLMLYIFQKKTTPKFLAVRKKMAEITATLTEFLHGISIIQIFHRGDYVKKRFDQVNREKFKDDVYVNLGVIFFFNTVFLMETLMIGLVLLLGAMWIAEGSVTVGTISMFIVLIWRSFEPIHRASEQIANIQKAIAGAKRIFALLGSDQKIPDPETPVIWRKLRKGIKFEDVWFSYTDDDNYALKDVSFETPVGTQTALVGATGGGKTSIISLLYRFFDPQRGKITVDGIDIRDITKEDLRKRFSLVLQDIHLFPGDIRSNLALESDEISDNKIVEAARIVNADRFIRRLPKGYKTEVSEKGANFSRGERQLLSFARALVFDPDLLILDEATSSVDPETERMIQESLKKLMKGRTSLVIAHRLATVLEANQILVVKRGEITERGTHVELMLNDDYYARLFHLQFKNGVKADAV